MPRVITGDRVTHPHQRHSTERGQGAQAGSISAPHVTLGDPSSGMCQEPFWLGHCSATGPVQMDPSSTAT